MASALAWPVMHTIVIMRALGGYKFDFTLVMGVKRAERED